MNPRVMFISIDFGGVSGATWSKGLHVIFNFILCRNEQWYNASNWLSKTSGNAVNASSEDVSDKQLSRDYACSSDKSVPDLTDNKQTLTNRPSNFVAMVLFTNFNRSRESWQNAVR